MKTTALSFLVLLASFGILFSCGSDDGGSSLTGTNTSIDEISGNWIATSAVFDIATTGPSQRIDVVAEGGTVTLSIQNNGRFTLTITVSGSAPETSTGQLSFDEDLLVVEFDDAPGDSEFFGIQNTANTLSINGQTEFDFDNDGNEEPAIAELDFVRA